MEQETNRDVNTYEFLNVKKSKYLKVVANQ